MGSKPQWGAGMFHFSRVLFLAEVKASDCEQKNGHTLTSDCGSNLESSEWQANVLPQDHQIPSSVQSKMLHITTSCITNQTNKGLPNTWGTILSYSLPLTTSEQGTDPDLFSEAVRTSFENDLWPLLYDDFSWCDDDNSDRSLEEGCLSLSEDCEDLTCDVLREGHRWRHKLLAMTLFWWSSCGNRPVTWHKLHLETVWNGSYNLTLVIFYKLVTYYNTICE
jgi:hypothetical protein